MTTTELLLKRAGDVFTDNEVLCLQSATHTLDMHISGAAWVAKGIAPQTAHQLALKQATGLALARLTGYSLWLLAAHSATQPESRIARYRKLWGSLRARGLEIPSDEGGREFCVESPEGIRYFGAMPVTLDFVGTAAAILEAEPISLLVAMAPERSGVIDDLVERGWDRPSFGPSREVLEAVCRSRGVVFWLAGAFDDPEVGAVALAAPAILERMLQ